MPDLQSLRTLLDPPPAVVALLLALLLILPPLLHRSWRRAEYAVLLVAVLVAVLLGEVCCRLLGLGAPLVAPVWIAKRATTEEFEYLMEPHSRLEFRYPSNPRGYFGSGNRIVSRVNSQGFRGPEALAERPVGSVRIAMLGDSFTLGTGVRDEDTLPARLEKVLTRTRPGVEVLNFGVGGTNTPRQIELLERQVLDYRPDIVLVVVFLNDAGRSGTVSLISKPWLLPALREHSQFLNALVRPVERRILHHTMIRHYRRGFDSDSPGWLAVQQALLRAAELCAGHGCKLMVVVYPVLFGLAQDYPFSDAHASIEAFCEHTAIPYADLLPALIGHDPSQLWVHATDPHPNEKAHALAAARLVAELERQALVSPHQPADE
ncbi:MAG: SGNH/GDSL hydrolase family protein [Thermoanaerobaculia bacterium]